MAKTIMWKVDYGWNSSFNIVAKDIDEAMEKARKRVAERTKDNNIESNKRIWGVEVLAIAMDSESDDDD